jgi:hypothetical protein
VARRLHSGARMLARFLLVSSFAACFACGSTEPSHETPSADHDAAPDTASSEHDAAPDVDGSSLPFAVDPSIARIHIDHVFLCCSTCFPPYRPVDYDRQTRLMSWAACDDEADAGVGGAVTDAGDASVPAVSRVLSTSEAQQLEALLKTVTYTVNPTCGGEDGEEYYLLTYDDAGHMVRKYSAQDVNCYGYPAAPRIEDVYNLLVTFRG